MYPTPLQVGAGTISVDIAVTTELAIPNTAMGESPKYLYVAATTAGFLSFGDVGLGAASATNSIWVTVAEPLIFNVSGWSYIRGTLVGQMTALENEGGLG